MTSRVYLDWNATTPLRPQARAAMLDAMDRGGNPSSVHGEGRAARALVEAARRAVAAAVGADPAEVVLTSGGTEANALALMQAGGRRLLVSAIEHPSVLMPAQARGAALVAVMRDGTIDLDDLRLRLGAGPPAFVSVMLANNETGVIQPIAEIAAQVHGAGGVVHVDAIQGLGKVPVDMATLGADFLTVSAHKLGGPPGVGALIGRMAGSMIPLQMGGGQEGRRRAGTENVPGIAGFGAAVEAAMMELPATAARMSGFRDILAQGLMARPGTVIMGAETFRLPNTLMVAVPGLRAETAVIGFDLAGIAVSSGSACSSGKVQPSHVVTAMGYPPDVAAGAIRLSLGWTTTADDVSRCVEAWRNLAGALLKT